VLLSTKDRHATCRAVEEAAPLGADVMRRNGAATMPKMKTHSGAKKRFKITGSGKVMHRQAGKMHLNEHKPSSRTRRLTGDSVMAKGDAQKAKKLLGGYKAR
jgi:large subunit ribosomal protein L35